MASAEWVTAEGALGGRPLSTGLVNLKVQIDEPYLTPVVFFLFFLISLGTKICVFATFSGDFVRSDLPEDNCLMPLVGLGGAVPAPVGTWEPLGPDTLPPLFGGGGPHRLVLQ